MSKLYFIKLPVMPTLKRLLTVIVYIYILNVSFGVLLQCKIYIFIFLIMDLNECIDLHSMMRFFKKCSPCNYLPVCFLFSLFGTNAMQIFRVIQLIQRVKYR